jgi:NAD(P)-dependent dehydrogenase (short-subunit alcohol dehydrogenase family)
MRLKEKVVIVTGGSQGIGEAIVRRYAREGARVAILNRTVEKAHRVVDGITSEGGSAIAVRCDVCKQADREEAIAAVLNAFGTIDVLVNNAGAYLMSPLGDTNEETFDEMIATNLKAVFFLCQLVLPEFERTGRGKIINIGSIFGDRGFPGSAIYCATKGAVNLLTKSLALELRERNVQVNAIAPGWIETPLNEVYRAENPDFTRRASEHFGGPGVWMKAEELTGAAVFLASDDANSVTGATLFVDRGWSAY